MRKVAGILLLAFLTIGTILIFLDESRASSISIITIDQAYSRLITDEFEVFSLEFYITDTKSFILDQELIDEIYLENDYNRISASISEIRQSGITETYQEQEYHLFYFDLVFPDVDYTNYFIDIPDCRLEIKYINSESITLEIGDLSLRFSPVNSSNHLDFKRMYAITADFEINRFIAAIVINLSNLSQNEISIFEVELGNSRVISQIKDCLSLEEAPAYEADIDLIYGYDYQHIQTAIAATKVLDPGDNLLLIPLVYPEGIKLYNRLPLIIRYTYQSEEYEYIIDDFQFFNTNIKLGDVDDRIREYRYNY